MLFLLDLPKPVHGMSNINKSIVLQAESRNIKFSVINTVPSYFYKLFGTKFWGVAKVIHSILCVFKLIFNLFLSKSEGRLVYRTINGGYGQVYDFFYFLIIRLMRSDLIVHHHSFNYINDKSLLFKLLLQVSRKNTIHIVLGSKMKEGLVDLYNIKRDNIIILSNSAFFDVEENTSKKNQSSNSIVIGHLANLCFEKGLDNFIKLCTNLNKAGFEFDAILAGPTVDDRSALLVEDACQSIPNLTYLGPVYGAQKSAFFKSLDVFVFPSKYKNEAEPLVLYEAAQYGAFNIGTEVGCMKDVLTQLGGVSFISADDFDEKVVSILIGKNSDISHINSSRQHRIDLFLKLRKQAIQSLKQVLDIMENESAKTK